MPKITIALTDGLLVVAHGEAAVDPMENALVIDSDEGTFAKFNWAHVLYYHITSESY